jgi:hypothetical protein
MVPVFRKTSPGQAERFGLTEATCRRRSELASIQKSAVVTFRRVTLRRWPRFGDLTGPRSPHREGHVCMPFRSDLC